MNYVGLKKKILLTTKNRLLKHSLALYDCGGATWALQSPQEQSI